STRRGASWRRPATTPPSSSTTLPRGRSRSRTTGRSGGCAVWRSAPTGCGRPREGTGARSSSGTWTSDFRLGRMVQEGGMVEVPQVSQERLAALRRARRTQVRLAFALTCAVAMFAAWAALPAWTVVEYDPAKLGVSTHPVRGGPLWRLVGQAPRVIGELS